RLDDLQVPPRQQLAGAGDEAGIAGRLDTVFGGAQRRGADAFSGRRQRPWQGPGFEALAHATAEPLPHAAEAPLLALIDSFRDAAGDHDPVDMPKLGDGIGQTKMRDVMRHRTSLDGIDDGVRHLFRARIHLLGRRLVADLPLETGLARMMPPRRIETDDLLV